MTDLPERSKAIRFYPPSYDVRVESVAVPQYVPLSNDLIFSIKSVPVRIEHPDDAIVKVKFAGLCGSDLHVYRGTEGVTDIHTCGHEFIGTVVALGSSFGTTQNGRPPLYSTLKVGEKVVSPFTTSCGECCPCSLGYTSRCEQSLLFGSPALGGGQAQYVRVPNAGGTLFNLDDPAIWPIFPSPTKNEAKSDISDPSLLLLADILPTGLFAAVQAINHPKVAAVLTGVPWPLNSPFYPLEGKLKQLFLLPDEQRVLTVAIVGLGPVGLCAAVAMLDILVSKQLCYRVVAVDPNERRREKMKAILRAMTDADKGLGTFDVCSNEDAKNSVKAKEWAHSPGCAVVLEVVGNPSALAFAYDLVQPFGVISSVGVHSSATIPVTGQQLYDKNVSLDFGRCPVRAMFPLAFELLVKRQDVLGTIGQPESLLDKVVGFDEAVASYSAFDKGEVGKVLFDPWK